MKFALPVALIAAIAGAAVGFFVARERFGKGETSAEAASGKNPADAGGSAAHDDDLKRATEDLARARRELDALRRQLESRTKPEVAEGPTAAETAARVKELMGRKEALVGAKDGRGLLKLMQELAKLGEAGYAGAMEIAALLRADLHSKKRQFGINRLDYFTALGGSMVPVMKWALANGDKSPVEFRLEAAGLLRWQDPDAAPAYLSALRSETDAKVASSVARALRGLLKPEMAADLEAAARAQAGNPDALRRLVESLADLPIADADAALRNLAADSNRVVAEEASVRLIALHPPAAGVLITETTPGSQAELTGMQRGDVIVSYDGNPLTSFRQLRNVVSKKSADTLTTIIVNRGGGLVTLQLKGGKIGVNGEFVKPK